MRNLVAALVLLGVGVSAAQPVISAAQGSPDQLDAAVLFIAQDMYREEVLEYVRARLIRSGHQVLVAAPDSTVAVGMDNTVIRPDIRLVDIDPGLASTLVLVGGSGAVLHWNDSTLHAACRGFAELDKPVAAIGLANISLARAGLLEGRRATVFPHRGAIDHLREGGARYVPNRVVTDFPVITAYDSRSYRPFAAALLRALERTE